MVKWLHSGFAALSMMASLVSARPSRGGKVLETRDTGRFVFAHLIVGITSDRMSSGSWDADMQRAKAYGIDAFALNIGTDSFTDTQLQYAYTSAQNNGMKVFLSFDFNFWSTGNAAAVGQKIAQYASLPAQLMVDGKVFVSTFVGDGLDVNSMKNAAGVLIYFAPNFHPSYGTDMSVVDGALNWMGWPNNGQNRAPNPGQTGTVEAGDSSYISALGSKGYVAPASPWFFTHYGAEVSYSKNWLFPGDMLWYQRWTELLTLGPRFIEIVSWNDFGESHYVGPLSSPHTDDGASKWVNDMPHDGWLDMAKPFIAAFKAGATAVDNYITSDQIIYWYRPQPMNTNCDASDTCTGPPDGWQTVTDNVFVVTLLKSAGTLQVSSGGNVQTFSASSGASSFSVPMGIGQQTFALTRNSQTVLSATSLKNIINGCVCGLYNFNAYVGTVPDGSSDPLGGDGFANFENGLRVSTCAATPSLGTAMASPSTSSAITTTSSTTTSTSTTLSTRTSPTTTSKPASSSKWSSTTALTTSSSTSSTSSTTTSRSSSSSSSSSSSTSSSSTTSRSTAVSCSSSTSPTSSSTTSRSSSSTTTPFTSSTTSSAAPVCTAGFGSNNYAGLCSFCCNHGYCPPGPCTCSGYGQQVPRPPTTGKNGVPAPGLDSSYLGLCSYACNHGYCPSGACVTTN